MDKCVVIYKCVKMYSPQKGSQEDKERCMSSTERSPPKVSQDVSALCRFPSFWPTGATTCTLLDPGSGSTADSFI